MRIIEYRIILPMTVPEYQCAQLFAVAEASKEQTGGGEGVEVVKNEPFADVDVFQDAEGNVYNKGQFTHKIYRFESKVPRFIKLVAPRDSLHLNEKAWNAYPYCRTVLMSDYMKDNFTLKIETMHVSDRGESHNAHNLPPELLKKREIVRIDIANDIVKPSDYKEKEDPSTYTSRKTGRGPLGKHWIQNVEPIMCAYKLVTLEFKWWGLQSRVENFIVNQERRLFTIFHRQVFCLTDEWYGKTLEQIRAIEEDTKRELEKLVKEKEKRGINAADED